MKSPSGLGVSGVTFSLHPRVGSPSYSRLFDVSKQVVGQMFVHGVNVFISDVGSTRSSGNACVLYFLNILIDTTLGVFTFTSSSSPRLIFAFDRRCWCYLPLPSYPYMVLHRQAPVQRLSVRAIRLSTLTQLLGAPSSCLRCFPHHDEAPRRSPPCFLEQTIRYWRVVTELVR